MGEKKSFLEEFTEAGRRILENHELAQAHCSPPHSEPDQRLTGLHLTPEQVAEVDTKVRELLGKFAQAVESTLMANEPEVPAHMQIAEANMVLNTAIQAPKEQFGDGYLTVGNDISAGLVDRLTQNAALIVEKADAILRKIYESGPAFTYAFDLRVDKENTLLKDVYKCFSELIRLTRLVDESGNAQIIHTYNTDAQSGEFSNYTKAMESEESRFLKEVRSREKLLQHSFNRIASEPPSPLTPSLITYYHEALFAPINFARQMQLFIESEINDPGVEQMDNEPRTLTYAERLRYFIEIYRYFILTTNSVRRMQLLLECREHLTQP